MMPAPRIDPNPRGLTLGQTLSRQASIRPDRPFIRFENRDVSYREAEKLTDRLAAGLVELGLGHGDHVAVILGNRPEFVWLYFALGKIGAVAVPVNTAAKGDLLAYYLEHSDAKALFVEAQLLHRFAKIQDECPRIERLVVVDDLDGTAGPPHEALRLPIHSYASLCDGERPRPDIEVRFNDVLLFQYTSGTTGPSKANVTPHCSALLVAHDFVGTFGYGENDVLFTCLPLFHGNAFLCSTLPALVAGATLALARRFSATTFWQEVKASGATQFNSLGAMTNILFGRPPSAADRDHAIRQCMMVPIPDFAQDFEARFGLRLTSVFAMTDFGTVTLRVIDDPPEKIRSAGRVRPEVTLAIMDDDDLPVPAGVTGELCLRSNRPWSASLGYYKMPDATIAAWRNLWFHTGDRGYVDEDGYLFFVDRKKDAIRRRGENISSFEVEQIISRHPDVAEVAVYPVRAELTEDEVMATVVRRCGSTLQEAELVAFCAERMAYYMVPRYLDFIDRLPKTMTEKVEKYKLRSSAEKRLSSIWDREREGIVIRREF